MGTEYRLRFRNDDHVDVVVRLGRLQHATTLSPSEIEFRSPDSVSRMPDVSLAVEPGGLYFCDNGGAGRDFLGRVIASLVSACGSVTVEEYEP